MPFRFLHTADWQLGKGFDRFAPDAAAALRRARLAAVERVARLATEHGAEAILVAGDVFDQIGVSDRTLRQFLLAVEGFGAPWVLLPGNHDPAIAGGPWARLRRMGPPANVVIADRPEPVDIGPATILPAPLLRRRDVVDLTEWFDEAATPSGRFRIGLAHGAIPDFLPEPGEALNPVALDRAARARLDYLALGDWHGRLRVDERTWYPGTPETDRFRDNASGGCLLVTLDEPGAVPRVEALDTGGISWRQETIAVVPGGAGAVAARLSELARAREAVLRIALEGVVDLATRAAVIAAAEDAAARVLDLALDESGLRVEPSADDLDAIDSAGFVRAALEDLRARLDGPEAAVARRALAHLHRLHHAAGE